MFNDEDDKRFLEIATDEVRSVKAAFERVASTDDGKKVFRYLTKRCLENVGELGDKETNAYNIGKQSIYLYLTSMIGCDSEEFATAIAMGEFRAWKQRNT